MIIGIIAQQFRSGTEPVGGVTITILASNVGSNLSGFPVRLDLSDMPPEFWDGVESAGGNIRVFSGSTALPVDLVKIDIPGMTGEMFFRANLSALTDNVFTVATIPDATAPDVTSPIGRNAVWSGYTVVGIFDELADRTGNGHTFTADGTVAYSDGWLSISGSGNLRCASVPFHTTWTMGVSCSLSSLSGSTNRTLLSYGGLDSVSTNRSNLVWRASAGLGLWNSTDTWEMSSLTPPAVDQRFRAHSIQVGTTLRQMFFDGVEAASDGPVAQRPIGAATGGVLIGANTTLYTERLRGKLNYFYLLEGALSPDWIEAEYLSWETDTFYEVE